MPPRWPPRDAQPHVVGFSSTASGTVSAVSVNVRGLPGTGAGTLQVVLFDGDQVVRYGGEHALATAQNLTETFSGISVASASTLRVKVVLHNTRGTGSLRYSQLWLSAQVESTSGPCSGDTRVLWGVRNKSEGTASEKLTSLANFEQAVGRGFKLDRQYLQWNDTFPTAYHLGTKAAGRRLVLSLNSVDNGTIVARWPAIARGDFDARIDALADAIKTFGDKVYFGFHHEPEDDLTEQGATSQDFVNAWRHIVDRMTARGVVRGTHVEYVWIMMAYSFQNGATRALGFYPGDAYVDWIGSDGYNWSDCRPSGGSWTTFESVFNGTKDFARAHGKRAMLAEWGSESQGAPVGTNKEEWFDQASTLLSSNPDWCVVQAMTYYNSDGPTASACEWWVYPSSVGTGFAGFKRMGLQPHFAR